LITLAVLLVIAATAVLAAWRPIIAPAMYACTGEQDTLEQIKGTAAYLYLKLAEPVPDLAPYVPIQNIPNNLFGVNTFLEQEPDPTKVARSLDLIRDMGFGFVRQEFPWEDIEISGKGDFWDHKWNVSAWAKYDRIVDMANERGLQLIVRLDHPPAWTRAVGNAKGSFAPPDNLSDFGDYVAAVVSRYKGRVRYYQIWNEPNIYPEWGEQPVNAAAYTRLLQVAYTRAKEADPDCVIISAGLAPTLEKGPKNLDDLTYLQQMYAAGAKGYFDVLAVMDYGLWTGPTDRRVSPDRTNFSRPELIRAIMVQHGDANKPIWAMEIGWDAVPPDFQGPTPYGRTTRDMQAQLAVEAYQRAQRDWPWMGMMSYWFLRRPTDTEKDQPFYYFALMEPDFTPWPAYDALRAYATQPAVLYPGYKSPDRTALHYSGPWQNQADSAAPFGQVKRGSSGATVGFTLWGSELDLVVRGPAQPSDLQVTIDGRRARVSPVRDATVGETRFALLRSLSPAKHTVEITVTGPSGGLPLAGLIVRSTDRRFECALGGLGVAIVAVLGVVLMRRSKRRA